MVKLNIRDGSSHLCCKVGVSSERGMTEAYCKINTPVCTFLTCVNPGSERQTPSADDMYSQPCRVAFLRAIERASRALPSVVQGVDISRVGSVSFSRADRCGLITRVVTTVTDLSFYGDRAVADSPRDSFVCLLSTTGRRGFIWRSALSLPVRTTSRWLSRAAPVIFRSCIRTSSHSDCA